MKMKIVPYGTQHFVKVVEIHVYSRSIILACGEVDQYGNKPEGAEAFICTYTPGDESAIAPSLAKPGDRGVLTFTEGGPFGGFWAYQPDISADMRRPDQCSEAND